MRQCQTQTVGQHLSEMISPTLTLHPPPTRILSPGLSRLSRLPHSQGSPSALLPHNLCNLPALSPPRRFPLFLFHFIPFNLCLIFTQGRGFTPELHLLSLYSSLFSSGAPTLRFYYLSVSNVFFTHCIICHALNRVCAVWFVS